MTVTTTPVPARTDAPTADVERPVRTRGGSRPLAVALLAAPLALLGGILLHPDDAHGFTRTMEVVRDGQLQWGAVHLLEPAAWVLLGLAMLLAMPRLAAERGRRPLVAGGVLCAVGFTSIGLIVYGHGEAFLHLSALDPEVTAGYAPLFERFETGMPLAAVPSLLSKVGLLLVAAGLVRARTVPLPVALGVVVAAVVMGGLVAGLPFGLGFVVTFGPFVALALCAFRRLATTGGPALG